ncbi:hypothetical protein HNY73_017751 [Argiope bruennichi]|uniref:CCHC-type domain-containing protein n=1 Tax=Argiope bruennichi TaxID=94029 RepID=A0A8T0EBV0_ARGBR|nr:hypothetical protein HNY73_017751 [Argiope bruennichi]
MVLTQHVVLTFSTPDLPKAIRVGYLHCSVRPHIPNSLRCFKCQRFGHSQPSCRGTVRCAKCAEIGYDSKTCTSETLKCFNCLAAHPAFSRTCPKWLNEKQIQATRVKQNASYTEARKLIVGQTPRPEISYSSVLTQKTDIGIQYDLNDITSVKVSTPSANVTNKDISAKVSNSPELPLSKVQQYITTAKGQEEKVEKKFEISISTASSTSS